MANVIKVSIVVTVLNEAKTISSLIDSLLSQSLSPNEIIIVDAGSTDGTQDLVKQYQQKNTNLHLFVTPGNRSVGRNFAIEKAANELIAITDAGCVPENDWLEELLAPFADPEVNVVSGFYKGLPQSEFEKSLIPFVLVMSDQVNSQLFLPSTRSMAIKKSTWSETGRLDPHVDPGEDYEFANRLVKNGIHPYFAQKAVVGWYPRKDLISAAKMFYSFARADARFKNPRNRIKYVFARVALLITLVLLTLFKIELLPLLIVFVLLYSVLAIIKNYKYVRTVSSLVYLPILQFCVDFCVVTGTLSGYWLE